MPNIKITEKGMDMAKALVEIMYEKASILKEFLNNKNNSVTDDLCLEAILKMYGINDLIEFKNISSKLRGEK